MRGETPVEAQMVTDGLETNQPGSQDLCSGTVSMLQVCLCHCFCVCIYVCVRSVLTSMNVVNA